MNHYLRWRSYCFINTIQVLLRLQIKTLFLFVFEGPLLKIQSTFFDPMKNPVRMQPCSELCSKHLILLSTSSLLQIYQTRFWLPPPPLMPSSSLPLVCVFGVVQRILHRAKLVTLFSSGGSIGFFVGWLFVKVVLTREEWREKCVYWKISAF